MNAAIVSETHDANTCFFCSHPSIICGWSFWTRSHFSDNNLIAAPEINPPKTYPMMYMTPKTPKPHYNEIIFKIFSLVNNYSIIHIQSVTYRTVISLFFWRFNSFLILILFITILKETQSAYENKLIKYYSKNCSNQRH